MQKINKMNYNELAKDAHQTAIDKGWYETKRDTNGLLVLILSEFFEAFEAYRNNKFAALEQHDTIIRYTDDFIKDVVFKEKFKKLIKDTLEDEIADVAIRSLDMAGFLKLDIDNVKPIALINDFSIITKNFTNLISGMYDEQMTGVKIAIILSFLEGVADLYKFDLCKHIKLKMAYNSLREYRHGNKAL